MLLKEDRLRRDQITVEKTRLAGSKPKNHHPSSFFPLSPGEVTGSFFFAQSVSCRPFVHPPKLCNILHKASSAITRIPSQPKHTTSFIENWLRTAKPMRRPRPAPPRPQIGFFRKYRATPVREGWQVTSNLGLICVHLCSSLRPSAFLFYVRTTRASGVQPQFSSPGVTAPSGQDFRSAKRHTRRAPVLSSYQSVLFALELTCLENRSARASSSPP